MATGYKLLVDGRWTDAASGKVFATHNPATGDHVADVAEADADDMDAAVAAARRAFDAGAWTYCPARLVFLIHQCSKVALGNSTKKATGFEALAPIRDAWRLFPDAIQLYQKN